MMPSVVAAEVTGALRDFLATGFGPSNAALAHVVDDFLAKPDNLAKGPYLSIALPFQPAPEGGEPFPQVPLGFTPYRHQRTAFSRLAADNGQSTLVATGTGSGKTECFLFPILDYCRERVGAPGIDTGDFATALARHESRGRFVVVEDELELEAMLNAPLERWRVFLHPSQRRLVERDWNGPARVLGAAGTGKTVVAMHRARWLARNLPGRGRILFTTFTRNLAADIGHNLGAICKPEELARIDVTNLDRWVVRFLRGRRYEFRIVFGRDDRAWQRALDLEPPDMDFADGFYDDEREQVVQAHGVTSLDEYLRVSRVGRGSRLNRAARSKAWRVFEEYRTQLAERGLKEVDDAYRDAAVLLQNDPEALDYAAVIVDEGQDMGAQAYRLLRAIVPAAANDLFVVGDGHQRIYGRNKVVLGRCGIDVRGRSRKLRLNYRTTEETRRWAARLLAGRAIDDLDCGSDDDKGSHR